jgi:hypothetical protein
MLINKVGLATGIAAVVACGAATWAFSAAPARPSAAAASSAPARQRAAPLGAQTTPAAVLPRVTDGTLVGSRLRCANRLAIAFTGYTPSDDLLAAADPQSQVDALLASADFKERFSRFVNAEFNVAPGTSRTDDAVYYVERYILDEASTQPWSDLFVGPYTYDFATPGDSATISAFPDANGLGYFHSPFWMRRYSGNENEKGLRLVTAYRILQNTLGIDLVPSTNGPGADISATGRMVAPCVGCHYNGPLPLDPVAGILSRRHKSGTRLTGTYDPPPEGSAFTVDGTTVTNDGELLHMLVNSSQFQFNACRLAFKFLYGRAEVTCEGPLFDKCMDAFAPAGTAIEDGKIQDALAAIAKDASFCQ